jgi:Spy/CpxP family protein refolding chaperone
LGILLLVFLCGAVAGAMAHASLHHRPFWYPSSKTEYLRSVQRELDLTPEQTQQMESILNDFAKYYQTVLADGKARILNILNPDQRRKFEKMMKERPH